MKTFITKGQNFTRNLVGFLFQKCFSKLNHYKSMFFFADKIRNDQNKKLIHQLSCSEPFILKSPFRIVLNSILLEKISAKFGVNPFHELPIGVYNLKTWKVINSINSFPRLYVNRTFSVDYSSKIGKFLNRPHSESFFGKLYHKEMLLATLND